MRAKLLFVCGLLALGISVFIIHGNYEDDSESDVPPKTISLDDEIQNPSKHKTNEDDSAQNEEEKDKLRNKIIAFWSIVGHSDTGLGLPWRISHLDLSQEKPWNHFIQSSVQPIIDKGIKRIQIHNPFGSPNGKVMQLTQYLQVQQKHMGDPAAGWNKIYDDFDDSWSAFKKLNPDVEIIMYFGSFDRDDILDSVGTDSEKTSIYYESLRPALDLGMSVGLDSAGGTDADSLQYALLSDLSRNTTVYIESWPWMSPSKPWLYDYNVEITADHYQRNWSTKPFNNQSLLTGEKIIIQTQPPKGHTWDDQEIWQPDVIEQYLEKDITYMGGLKGLFTKYGDVDEFLDQFMAKHQIEK